MGKVKKEKLPTPDTNPVDGDELIKATKPKKECCKSLEERISKLEKDIDIVGNWIENVDNDLAETEKQLKRISVRLGLVNE